MSANPTIVVITPVRNEAWVLEAFLTSCSLWADHIIIADQHSDDGSREIAQRFPKVRLIDNPNPEWVEYEVRTLLLQEAAAIEGDKIIFGLDADEFLPEGYERTQGWQRIMGSKESEIFYFRWENCYGDFEHHENVAGAEWAAHFGPEIDVVAEYRARGRNAVHCSRVPCVYEHQASYIPIEDLPIILLGNLYRARVRNKYDFYSVVNIDKQPLASKASPISLYREYTYIIRHSTPRGESVQLAGVGHEMVKMSGIGQHYIDEMVAIFRREGCYRFRHLCIWDNPDLRAAGINYRPPLADRVLHAYLRCTQPVFRWRVIRLIDKGLRYLLRRQQRRQG